MQLRSKFWLSFFIVGLMVGTVSAKQARQPDLPSKARVVRVRTGTYAGMCVGYCDNETIIEPGSIRRVSRAFSEKKKYPEMRMRHAITKKEWDDLQNAIDAKVLAAFT